ncbi:MAG TPA: hypothetical protein VK588_15245 [Chitinophagaceae bacterium]|nr:hypothetical protein [Chitinophagaceae bacterium]
MVRKFVCLLLLFALLGCNQSRKIPLDFDYGKIGNGIYTNKFFGFEIPVPGKWFVQNKELLQQLQKKIEDSMAKKNEDLASRIRASDISSAVLLTVLKKNEIDTTSGDFNSSFMILAENIGTISGVSKGDQYLVHAKAIMKQTGASYKFPSDIYEEKIGNKEFYGMDIILNINGTDLKQSYYSTVDKGFALSMIISYDTEDQHKELKSIINNIKFDENL